MGPDLPGTDGAGLALHYLSQELQCRLGDLGEPKQDLWLWQWRLHFWPEQPLQSQLL